jgi:hypothetical protein
MHAVCRTRLGIERLESRRLMTTYRFAAFGDYGDDTPAEAAVANLVKSWQPDGVLTLGDNNYGVGAPDTIDRNIGQYYHEFIGNYVGSYGPGSPVNRFFPTLGNHDWWYFDPDGPVPNANPYLGYFTLPGAGFQNSSGNERYYDFVLGNVHFFALDSNFEEPDGRTVDSPQADWLRGALAASQQAFNIVYFHHAPFTSGAESGNDEAMQWPFAQWGADAVLSAHDHIHERLAIDGIPYFVNGLGGASIYPLGEIEPGSQFRYNGDFGAMLITATETTMTFEFYAIGSPAEPVDRLVVAVPEPAAWVGLAVGATALVALVVRRQRSGRQPAAITAIVERARIGNRELS